MKRKIFRLYLTLKKNHYYFNSEIHIGFNIANLFCKIELFNNLFNFLFRIVWIKKYLYTSRRKELNDEARIICNLIIRGWYYHPISVRDYFSKLIFIKKIDIGRYLLSCGFRKDLDTSINISVWSSEIIITDEDNYIYRDITISLFGFFICLGR